MLLNSAILYKSHGLYKFLVTAQQNINNSIKCVRFNSKLSNLKEKEVINLFYNYIGNIN